MRKLRAERSEDQHADEKKASKEGMEKVRAGKTEEEKETDK